MNRNRAHILSDDATEIQQNRQWSAARNAKRRRARQARSLRGQQVTRPHQRTDRNGRLLEGIQDRRRRRRADVEIQPGRDQLMRQQNQPLPLTGASRIELISADLSVRVSTATLSA